VYFYKLTLKKDKTIAAITSSIGCAEGKPKFQRITPISQMK
jgi:hypothetical protein